MDTTVIEVDNLSKNIEVPHVTNFRDIGGYIGAEGKKVRKGQFYRCAGLSKLDESDFKVLKELNLQIIVDFRSDGERDKEPDIIPEGCKYYHFSGIVTMDEKGDGKSKFGGNLDMKSTIMEIIQKNLEMPDPMEYLRDGYKIMAEQSDAFRKFFKVIKDNPDKPMAFHCTAGKDRTGIAAALILLTLGVSEEKVMEDYLFSNIYRERENNMIIDSLRNYISKEEYLLAIRSVLEVNSQLLEVYFSRVKELYGDWENYFEKALDLSLEDRIQLRRRYLV